MNSELIEFLLGLYFIGVSIVISKTVGSPAYTRTIDVFKFVFGIILILLALQQGVKLI